MAYFKKKTFIITSYILYLLFLIFCVDIIYARFFEKIPSLGDVALQMETPKIHRLSDINNLFYELKPMSETDIYSINSVGMRGKEPCDGGGNYRVIVMGDSLTFGPCVKEKELFTEVAEATFNHSGKKIEILNAGVCGYNTRQEYEALKNKYVKLKPNLVIFAYCINDASDTYVQYLPDNYVQEKLLKKTKNPEEIIDGGAAYEGLSGKDYLALILPMQFMFLNYEADRWLLLHSGLYRAISVESFRKKAFIKELKDLPSFLDNVDLDSVFRNIGNLARDKGFEVRFIILPFDESMTKYSIPALQLLKANGIEIWDFNSTVTDKVYRDKIFLPDRLHLNTLGHRVVGELLAGRLLESDTGGSNR